MPCASGAADAVDVGHGIVGGLVVDYMRDVVDVDATCRDIGGNQHVDAAWLFRRAAERCECLFSCVLGQIAVHGANGEAQFGKVACQCGCPSLGAGEYDCAAATWGLESLGDDRWLVHPVGLEHDLCGCGVGC